MSDDHRHSIQSLSQRAKLLGAPQAALPLGLLGSLRKTFEHRHEPLARGDIVLLLTDGAWTPLTLDGLRASVASVALRSLAELPEAILRAASRRGVADDMTVVAARRR